VDRRVEAVPRNQNATLIRRKFQSRENEWKSRMNTSIAARWKANAD